LDKETAEKCDSDGNIVNIFSQKHVF